MYRVYGKSKFKGWEKVDIVTKKENAISIGKGINHNKYYAYMVIENIGNGDTVTELEYFKNSFKDSLKVNTTPVKHIKENKNIKDLER